MSADIAVQISSRPSESVNAVGHGVLQPYAPYLHVPATAILERATAADGDGAGSGAAEHGDVRAGRRGDRGFNLQRAVCHLAPGHGAAPRRHRTGYFLVADQVAFSSKPAYTAVPFMAVGLSIVPL